MPGQWIRGPGKVGLSPRLPNVPRLLDGLAPLLVALRNADPATWEHCQRVAALAHTLGRAAGIEEPRLHTAGLIHDLGKIGTPAALLTAARPLTDAEYADLRGHAALGAQLCTAFPDLARLAPVVRAHHENWDGSGYPDGIRGPAIPLWARVIRIADTWDVLTTGRPYRVAVAPARARTVIRDGAGREFDPQLARVFLSI